MTSAETRGKNCSLDHVVLKKGRICPLNFCNVLEVPSITIQCTAGVQLHSG